MIKTLLKNLCQLSDPIHVQEFKEKKPFPSVVYHDLIPANAYNKLKNEFPDNSFFIEQHEKYRGSQRPHDRFYLCLSEEATLPGQILHQDLPVIWQKFIESFQSSSYQEYIHRLTGEIPSRIRFAWHRSHLNSEVSPHIDVIQKLGTQIFYFNDADDWNPEWGGNTLLLSKCRVQKDNPDFHEFDSRLVIDMMKCQSLFFTRTGSSWHGVEKLNCPENYFRNTFNVILEK